MYSQKHSLTELHSSEPGGPCVFEIQCMLVEAAAVIWMAETIWVYSSKQVALQSIYLQVEASITSSCIDSLLILFVTLHKLNHSNFSRCCIIFYKGFK